MTAWISGTCCLLWFIYAVIWPSAPAFGTPLTRAPVIRGNRVWSYYLKLSSSVYLFLKTAKLFLFSVSWRIAAYWLDWRYCAIIFPSETLDRGAGRCASILDMAKLTTSRLCALSLTAALTSFKAEMCVCPDESPTYAKSVWRKKMFVTVNRRLASFIRGLSLLEIYS